MITGIVNTGYEAISAGILAAFLAQVIKFFIFTIKTKKIKKLPKKVLLFQKNSI